MWEMFEFLKPVTIKIPVFWDVTPCSLVDIYILDSKYVPNYVASYLRRQPAKLRMNIVFYQFMLQVIPITNTSVIFLIAELQVLDSYFVRKNK
jgi:hypothetical protein